jgi:hypothetical protein
MKVISKEQIVDNEQEEEESESDDSDDKNENTNQSKTVIYHDKGPKTNL